jgi:hypothetical protein
MGDTANGAGKISSSISSGFTKKTKLKLTRIDALQCYITDSKLPFVKMVMSRLQEMIFQDRRFRHGMKITLHKDFAWPQSQLPIDRKAVHGQ